MGPEVVLGFVLSCFKHREYFGFLSLFHELTLPKSYQLWPSGVNMKIYPSPSARSIRNWSYMSEKETPNYIATNLKPFMCSFKPDVIVENLLLLSKLSGNAIFYCQMWKLSKRDTVTWWWDAWQCFWTPNCTALTSQTVLSRNSELVLFIMCCIGIIGFGHEVAWRFIYLQ